MEQTIFKEPAKPPVAPKNILVFLDSQKYKKIDAYNLVFSFLRTIHPTAVRGIHNAQELMDIPSLEIGDKNDRTDRPYEVMYLDPSDQNPRTAWVVRFNGNHAPLSNAATKYVLENSTQFPIQIDWPDAEGDGIVKSEYKINGNSYPPPEQLE